jgi:gluconolactonase
VAFGAPPPTVGVPIQGTGVDVRDERFRAILPEEAPLIERVTAGFRFIEGPVWVDDSLLFVDNNLDTIFRLRDHPWGPEVTVFRYPGGTHVDQPPPPGVGGPGPNGLALDKQGRLLVTEHGNRRITRTEPDGRLTVLTTTYQGKRFNSPNDMAVRSDNTSYFTDPPYGLAMQSVGKELDFQGIYRIAPDGRISLEGMWNRPNGLCLSPDEGRLYVVDSVEFQARVYDVQPDGSLRNERLFADVRAWGPNGGPDGVKCDAAGNFYLTGVKVDDDPAGQGTVMVFDPGRRPPGADHPPRAPRQLRLRGAGLEDAQHDGPQRPLPRPHGRRRHPHPLTVPRPRPAPRAPVRPRPGQGGAGRHSPGTYGEEDMSKETAPA